MFGFRLLQITVTSIKIFTAASRENTFIKEDQMLSATS